MIKVLTLGDLNRIQDEKQREAIGKVMLMISNEDPNPDTVEVTLLETDEELLTMLTDEEGLIDGIGLVLEEGLYEIIAIGTDDDTRVYFYEICGAPKELQELVTEMYNNGFVAIYSDIDGRIGKNDN
jgi:hypothetical protein